MHNIMLFLQGHGISAAYATKIYRTYGDQAIEMVTANPYRLAHDVFGIGFKLADRIAQQLGMLRDTPERIEAGVLFCLQQGQEQGHCFLPEELLATTAAELLAGQPEDGTPALPGAPPTLGRRARGHRTAGAPAIAHPRSRSTRSCRRSI